MNKQERELKKLKEARSEYFRALAAKRKNPAMPFKDPEFARRAQLKSAEKRKINADKIKESEGQSEGQSVDSV